MPKRPTSSAPILPEAYAKRLAKELIGKYKDYFKDRSNLPLSRWEKFFFEYARSPKIYESLGKAGISYSCYKKHKDDDSGVFLEILSFFDEMITQRGEDMANLIATEGLDVRFLQWWLSKRAPEKYGDKLTIDQNVNHSIKDMTTEDLKKLIGRGADD